MELTTDKMTDKPKSAQELVDELRRGFLGALYEDGQRTRYVKRRIVESLLGVISAARASGFTWDELADICRKHGLDIAPSTLKTYYVDLREEREHQRVKAEAKTIVKDVNHHRLVRETANGQLANEAIKKRAAQRLASRPKLMSSVDDADIYEQKATPVAPARTAGLNAAKPGVRKRPIPEIETPINAPVDTGRKSSKESGSRSINHPPLEPGQAKHIDQLADEAKAVKTPTPIYEKLELKPDGRVYTSSGEPFVGVLAVRQVSILRSARFYMANATPEARSTNTVVKMPSKL